MLLHPLPCARLARRRDRRSNLHLKHYVVDTLVPVIKNACGHIYGTCAAKNARLVSLKVTTGRIWSGMHGESEWQETEARAEFIEFVSERSKDGKNGKLIISYFWTAGKTIKSFEESGPRRTLPYEYVCVFDRGRSCTKSGLTYIYRQKSPFSHGFPVEIDYCRIRSLEKERKKSFRRAEWVWRARSKLNKLRDEGTNV